MNWEQIIQQILQDGKVLGTKAFELSLKQVYNVIRIDTITGIFFTILLIVFAVILYVSLKNYNSEENRYYNLADYPNFWVGLLGSIISSIFVLNLWINVIMYSGNPEWYAIRWLLEDIAKVK